MSPHDEASLAEMENRALALLSRLHVLLRRESGRITDIDYMRIDPAYCKHVLAFGMQTPSPDTKELCSKLAHLYFDPDGLFSRKPHVPLVERLLTRAEPSAEELLDIAPAAPVPEPAAAPAVPLEPPVPQAHHEDIDRSYVGRLR